MLLLIYFFIYAILFFITLRSLILSIFSLNIDLNIFLILVIL